MEKLFLKEAVSWQSEWPEQSKDLNSFELLWEQVDCAVQTFI